MARSQSDATLIKLTPEEHADMLSSIGRLDAALKRRRVTLKSMDKRSTGYAVLQKGIRESSRQIELFREQVKFLASGKATKADERECIEMIAGFIVGINRDKEARFAEHAKSRLGLEMIVTLPDGSRAPAWQLWLAQLMSSEPNADYLEKEAHRLEAAYGIYAKHIPASERFRRAFRLALKGVGLEVVGHDVDEHDLRVLMIHNGLEEDEFSIEMLEGEPYVCMNMEAMRRLGAPEGVKITLQ